MSSAKSQQQQSLRTIRGDKIAWVKGSESNCSFMGYLINQVQNITTMLYKNKFYIKLETEFIIYEIGIFIDRLTMLFLELILCWIMVN